MPRVAVVTGSNKGIGNAIVNRLARENPTLTVILTARSVERGKEACDRLESEGLKNVVFHPLDVLSSESIKDMKTYIKDTYGGLDILVCNAGIATKGSDFNSEIAFRTIETNYYATMAVCDAFWDLLNDNSRVVIIGSTMGKLGSYSKELQKRFLNPDLSREDLNALVEEFIKLADKGKSACSQAGWPTNTYSVSKAAVHALTRILAREEGTKRKICVNACCPGWVATDMGGSGASLTPDQGAMTPCFLAMRPSDDVTTGLFFQRKKETSWI